VDVEDRPGYGVCTLFLAFLVGSAVLLPLCWVLDSFPSAQVGLPVAAFVVILLLAAYLGARGRSRRLPKFRLPGRPPRDTDDPELRRLWADVCERYPEVAHAGWEAKERLDGWGLYYVPMSPHSSGPVWAIFIYGAVTAFFGATTLRDAASKGPFLFLLGIDLLVLGAVMVWLRRPRWVDHDDAVERLRVRMRGGPNGGAARQG
jgi:hypothetical protein